MPEHRQTDPTIPTENSDAARLALIAGFQALLEQLAEAGARLAAPEPWEEAGDNQGAPAGPHR